MEVILDQAMVVILDFKLSQMMSGNGILQIKPYFMGKCVYKIFSNNIATD
jgi:hypothetical protein